MHDVDRLRDGLVRASPVYSSQRWLTKSTAPWAGGSRPSSDGVDHQAEVVFPLLRERLELARRHARLVLGMLALGDVFGDPRDPVDLA
jgi:hypothetical protein